MTFSYKAYYDYEVCRVMTVKIVFIIINEPTQKQPPEVFCKKGVLRNFGKFTGQNLCESHFFNKVAGLHLN